VGKEDLEETILKTNLEAVKEVSYQIRLRNLGGIIIVDFIDMEQLENREKVLNAFREALSKDRAKYTISHISELGLIQMTRKRVRESLGRILCETCPYCEGKGFVKSTQTLCYEILRKPSGQSSPPTPSLRSGSPRRNASASRTSSTGTASRSSSPQTPSSTRRTPRCPRCRGYSSA
jgi:hypothetical protein